MVFTRYQPRPLRFVGVEEIGEYRLKVYAIRYAVEPDFEWGRFAGWEELAASVLPQPAVAEARPGVGFAVLHQAQGEDYLILGWWDWENELPTRVFLRGKEGWCAARGGRSSS